MYVPSQHNLSNNMYDAKGFKVIIIHHLKNIVMYVPSQCLKMVSLMLLVGRILIVLELNSFLVSPQVAPLNFFFLRKKQTKKNCTT